MPPVASSPAASSRRRFLALCSTAGLSGTLFPGALLAVAAADPLHPAGLPPDHLPPITPAMIEAAEAIAAVSLTPEQRTMLVEGLTAQRASIETIRSLHLPNAVPPAFLFDPLPAGATLPAPSAPAPARNAEATSLPATGAAREHALAFATLPQLALYLRRHEVTSLELTRLALTRLRRYDPTLHFVITYTEDRALAQAAQADRELAAGNPRGPLHGIPWGAKDLLAVKGYPTTWGAAGFEDQHFDTDATVVQRLDAAGAVLVAKLTLGALASGDLWGYPAGSGKPGDRTRNPWNPRQGSSGSSAGSAASVASGCLPFALGTETLGSISSPSTRCGCTGHRPTFGFVPRTGAMALSWTMDKIGPITRSAEDCALVMAVIHGPDGHDKTVHPAAFTPSPILDLSALRVGYLKSDFDAPISPEVKPLPPNPTARDRADFDTRRRIAAENLTRLTYDHRFDLAALDVLRSKLNLTLVPVELPHGLHLGDQTTLLEAEAAAAFDELTLSGRDALLAGQRPDDWPNIFRRARFLSAVDYIQMQRARTLTLDAMARLFADVDIIVAPSGGNQLLATNLSGHPAVIVPNGLRGPDAPISSVPEADDALEHPGGPGTPVSITFLGALYTDDRLLAFASAYQHAAGFLDLHPTLP